MSEDILVGHTVNRNMDCALQADFKWWLLAPAMFLSVSLSGCVTVIPDRIASRTELEQHLQRVGIGGATIDDGTSSGGVCTVDLSGSGIVDLARLKDLPINSLVLSGKTIVNLVPLKGMPLRALCLLDTNVKDLTPLHGMRLVSFLVRNTPITDISVLRQMPLVSLDLQNTNVRDLSALRGAPFKTLKTLFLNDSPVSDLLPLQGMNLEYFSFSPKHVEKGMNIIRDMQSLKGIGDPSIKSPKEFWQEYDSTQ